MIKFLISFLFIFQAHGAPAPWDLNQKKVGYIDSEKWSKFMEFVSSKEHGHSTNAILVIYQGKLIEHQTFNGFKKGQTHRQWSISKSITNILVGIALKKGIINLETPVNKFFKLHQSSKESPTIKHLLGMSSGFDWNEGYEANPLKSNVIAMLYTNGHKDMAAYTAQRPLSSNPGERFYYSSGDSNLIMGILRKSMGLNDYSNFPWSHLFNLLDIKTATWEKDQSGTFVGSSYLFMSPEDLARIGYLYLKKGFYRGRQIVDQSWVQYSLELSMGQKEKKVKKGERYKSYGAHWWLNKDLPLSPGSRPYPSLPEDAFLASGHHGQILLVVPSKNLIMVRNGADKNGDLDRNKFFALLMGALK